mmetsp:Transcript_37169/g.98392  ORF Transcript_37169/g.98392 Transcript_37169/m.98392 type:complete len:412 (+) Transcript_37169:432-1667(+)
MRTRTPSMQRAVTPLALLHLAAGLDDLVDEQQLRRDHRRRVEHLPLDVVVVPDARRLGVHGLPREDVDANLGRALLLLLKDLEHRVLRVVARVLCQCLRDRQQRLGIRGDAELGAASDRRLVLRQLCVCERLEATGAGDEGAVLDGVGDRAGAIAHRLEDLRDDVLVRALDEDRAREGVLDALEEGVRLLSEANLLARLAVAEAVNRERIERVDLLATAREDHPLHVTPLGTAQREDALLCEHVERERVNALLVDNDERLVGGASLLLEVEDHLRAVVDPLALGCHHLLALLRRVVVEARVDLGLLVLEVVVHREDAALLKRLGHARVAATMVHDEALDEARVCARLVHHVHRLDHVQVDRRAIRLADAQHGVNNDVCEDVGELRVHFGAQRGLGDLQEEVARGSVHLQRR